MVVCKLAIADTFLVYCMAELLAVRLLSYLACTNDMPNDEILPCYVSCPK